MLQRQIHIAELVAAGSTIKDAASVVGISERTAYEISGTAEFRQMVADIRTERVQHVVGKLMEAVPVAIDTLQTLCTGADKDSDKIAAARTILNNLKPLSEDLELRRRLDELERRASEAADEAGVGGLVAAN